MTRSDFTLMSLNSNAIGDLFAAAPVVKFAIENCFTNGNYLVSVRPAFEDIFHFVPRSKLYPHDKPYSELPKGTAIVELNDMNKKAPNVARLTPSKIHLSHYASIGLLGRILSWKDYHYVPLNLEGIEAPLVKNSVLLSVAHRDENRSWPVDEILKTAQWLKENGYQPVFIGQSKDQGHGWKKGAVSEVIAPDYVVDLRNQLTIPQSALVMSRALAIAGIDGGSIHLAGTTSVPIVCGFTNVDPETRAIPRKEGQFVAIVPEIECRFCQTNWQLGWHNFSECYYKHSNCTKEMTAAKFIAGLKVVLEVK